MARRLYLAPRSVRAGALGGIAGGGVGSEFGVGVRAGGPNLDPPAPPFTPPVVVQLQGSNGECWSATYSATILANGGGNFRAKPDGP